MRLSALAFVAAAPLLLAQLPGAGASNSTSGFAGPSLGFVSGATPAELQPILGIPGAARLGDPISLPNTVTQLYLAPGHYYALTAQGAGNPVAMVMLRVAGVTQANLGLSTLPSALAQPDLVAFSPTGRSAALYSQQANRIQVFTGLPTSPQLVENIGVALGGSPQKLAISDDAQALLVADATGTLWALSANNAPVPVYQSSQIAALMFVSQTHDAIVGDPVLGTVAVVQTFTSTPGVKILVPPSSGGCQPQAAASTADGKTILLACPAQHVISSIDRASGAENTYKINGSPCAFDATREQDTFLMSPPDGNTYWLFTWRPGAPVISFIGAVRHVN